jgi:tetratricopeptide (TPR) repeat protein
MKGPARDADSGPRGEKVWQQLASVARAADGDDLRNQLRDVWERDPKDRQALLSIAGSDRAAGLPAPTLVLLGRRLADSGAVEEGVAVLRKAQRRFPADFWINQRLGLSLLKMVPMRVDDAVRYFSVAVAVRPDSPGAHLHLGIALARKGFADEAIAEYSKAIALKPDYEPAWHDRGGAYYDLKQFDAAIANYSKAIELRPDHAGAWTVRGSANRELKHFDKAIADYSKAIELEPNDAKARNLVTDTLDDDLTFELSERQQDVQGQPTHRVRRVKLLCDRDERHAVAIERLHDPGKVHERAAEAIHLVHDDAIDLAGGDVGQQPIERGPIHVSA